MPDHFLLHAVLSALASTWPIWLVVVLAATLAAPRVKGMIGEAAVNWMARRQLDPAAYHLIPNVTLPVQGGTTQIDHVIVSPFGVFVVETKNMRGVIYGEAHQHTWTQRLGRQSFLFQNPLRQNYKHTQALTELLNLSPRQVHSLVVFVGDGKFATAMPDNVVRGMDYIRYILSKTEHVLSQSETTEISVRIENGRLTPSLKTQRQHVRHVKSIREAKDRQPPTCPKCGGTMSERQVRTGPLKGKRFLGCNRFPQCRGTLPIPREK